MQVSRHLKKKNADVSGLSMFVEAPDIGVIAKT